MATNTNWKIRFNRELEQAQSARASGNEGKARVCARRAAGIVIEAYYSQQGNHLPGPSAYNHLRFLAENSQVSQQVREVAAHFLVKTDPNFTFPIQVDLIQEARWLADKFFGYKA
jgi:hypothetical protein